MCGGPHSVASTEFGANVAALAGLICGNSNLDKVAGQAQCPLFGGKVGRLLGAGCF